MKFFKSLIAYALLGGVIGGFALGLRGIIKYNTVSDEDFYNNSITKKIYGSGQERLFFNNPDSYCGPKADRIFDINEGDTLVIYYLDGKYGFLNIVTGEDIISSKEHNFEFAWSFDTESGLAAVIEKGKIGFIKKDGSFHIKPQYPFNPESLYDFECRFKNGYCLIPTGQNIKFGLIDKENRVIIPFKYDSLGELENGYRIIELDGKYGLFDSLSNEKLLPAYDDISINQFGIVLYDASKHSQELVDFDLKTVISKYVFDDLAPIYIPEFDSESEYEDVIPGIQSGYSTFTIDDKTGVISNIDGKVIIDAIWDEIEFFNKHIFKAGLNGKYFLIDNKGKFIQ